MIRSTPSSSGSGNIDAGVDDDRRVAPRERQHVHAELAEAAERHDVDACASALRVLAVGHTGPSRGSFFATRRHGSLGQWRAVGCSLRGGRRALHATEAAGCPERWEGLWRTRQVRRNYSTAELTPRQRQVVRQFNELGKRFRAAPAVDRRRPRPGRRRIETVRLDEWPAGRW